MRRSAIAGHPPRRLMAGGHDGLCQLLKQGTVQVNGLAWRLDADAVTAGLDLDRVAVAVGDDDRPSVRHRPAPPHPVAPAGRPRPCSATACPARRWPGWP